MLLLLFLFGTLTFVMTKMDENYEKIMFLSPDVDMCQDEGDKFRYSYPSNDNKLSYILLSKCSVKWPGIIYYFRKNLIKEYTGVSTY